MKIASIAEAKAKLSDYVERCRHEPIVVTRHGHPRAALVPLESDDDLERYLLSRNPKFLELIGRSERSGRVSIDEAEGLLGVSVHPRATRSSPKKRRTRRRRR